MARGLPVAAARAGFSATDAENLARDLDRLGERGPDRARAGAGAGDYVSATAASGVATWKLKLSSRYSLTVSASCPS